ncbi:MAG: aminoacyl-tRNA hydrolase, partial [Minisyncoccia bacterium]
MIVFALGNPGKEYELTRHNAGRVVLPEGIQNNVQTLYPDTYMNESGQYVAKIMRQKPEGTLWAVIHDDIDLPIGTMKISVGSGHGGHNGVRSTIDHMGKDFIRIRIGICPTDTEGSLRKPRGFWGQNKTADYVLQKFSGPELEKIRTLTPNVIN